MTLETDVLICGAGPTGLMLALRLTRSRHLEAIRGRKELPSNTPTVAI